MGIIDDMKNEVKKELESAETKVKEVADSVEKQAEKENVGIIDVLSEKVLSRKLLVWIVASAFLGLGKITPDEWMGISLGYIGIQGVTDLAAKWKAAGK
jgi:Mg2+ and Co2+ transporter CorA